MKPGPQPKSPETRRRRNLPVGAVELDPEGRQGPPPEMPAAFDDLGWLPAVRGWWATIWASPMATQWLDSDVLVLGRLATLMQLALLGDTKGAAEARQLEDRYGLNPQARKSLGWALAGEPGAGVDRGASAPVVSLEDARRADPRKALSAPGR